MPRRACSSTGMGVSTSNRYVAKRVELPQPGFSTTMRLAASNTKRKDLIALLRGQGRDGSQHLLKQAGAA